MAKIQKKSKKKATAKEPTKLARYKHKDKTRKNNPKAGAVTPDNDPIQVQKKHYKYDPHLDPQLQWAGKAEHTSFEVPTVSLHTHESIDPHSIIRSIFPQHASSDDAEGEAAQPALFDNQVTSNSKEDDVAQNSAEPSNKPLDNITHTQKLKIQESALQKQKNPHSYKSEQIEDTKKVGTSAQNRMTAGRTLAAKNVGFYQHDQRWKNRLIAGDSLLVMNSLLEKEGLAGQVQCIYIDPPYGIKYGSNFQPFTNKRDVKDKSDDHLSTEPEVIKAFRDTWQLGIHSYLSYMRDRLLLARELLTDSGSCFVQISDENVHLVRALMDEIFGKENFVTQIYFATSSGFPSVQLSRVGDYIVQYSKSVNELKYKQLFFEKDNALIPQDAYKSVELMDGTRRRISREEMKGSKPLPEGSRIFSYGDLQRTGSSAQSTPIHLNGKTYRPLSYKHWAASYPDGMNKLIAANRIEPVGKSLAYVRFFQDNMAVRMTNLWSDTSSGSVNKKYVVETNTKVIQRCILMTTDPGDLVLDPTCGSGTTAYVAEQWGRRWITCDTSRVALALAKQRLMTANFDYYELKDKHQGVAAGFNYKTVPHITLKSIANNPEIKEGMTKQQIDAAIEKYADSKILYDKPHIDTSKLRVSGPFTVEAVPAIVHLKDKNRVSAQIEESAPLSQKKIKRHNIFKQKQSQAAQSNSSDETQVCAFDTGAVRVGPLSTDTLDSAKNQTRRAWLDELQRAGIRGKKGQAADIEFNYLQILGNSMGGNSGTDHLYAQGETKDGAQKVVVCFGTEYAPLEQRIVDEALKEAEKFKPHKPTSTKSYQNKKLNAKGQKNQHKIKTPSPSQTSDQTSPMRSVEANQNNNPELLVIFCAFQFDPEAGKKVDSFVNGMRVIKAQMDSDIFTTDLKKKPNDDKFWLIGQPEVRLNKLTKGSQKGLYTAEVLGFDYYNNKTNSIEGGNSDQIAMWLLDTDYDGLSVCPRQVFFPMAGPKDSWDKFKKLLNAQVDDAELEPFRGTKSKAFKPGAHNKIAVKIIDDRGLESLVVQDIETNKE